MGDFLQSILGGSGAAPAASNPLAQYQDPGMKMFGITPDMLNRGGISETGAIPGQAADPGVSAEEAIIQAFKPKKISFWGALGDQLLKHWGAPAAFGPAVEQKNLRRAMEGFTKDPMEAIARIAQIPGYEAKAWDLMNQVDDNTRARELQDSTIGTRREKIINSANRIFGGVKPDGSNWGVVRGLYMDMLERNNIKDVYLPEQYDEDFIRAQIASGMTLKEQDDARYKDRRLQQMDRRLDQADTAETGRNTRAAAAESGRNARAATAETGRNTRAAAAEAGRNARSKNGGTLERKLPDGSTIKYSDDKSRAIVVRPNGKKHYLERDISGHYKTTKIE